ncbi:MULTISPECIES: hypothetical protein [Solibacillus]|uniref:NusG-like N-terminal domain-containing protein n=1 Tax=Solibacillus merdavium TaxID=2762218 RepID=A0ABR8XSZ4_9BACL|nr:hypothetical protein [Solibacillus merdavium]MBD8035052.1 hypothetical protein [Solibacillus merdavium]
MNLDLKSLIQEFSRTEITTLWMHHRIEDKYYNIFSIVELCPIEQQYSLPIESRRKYGERVPFVYIKLDQHRTLYLCREFRKTPEEGLNYFLNPKISQRALSNAMDNVTINSIEKVKPILTKVTLFPSMPLEYILPKRSVAFRICASFDDKQMILNQLNEQDIFKVDTLTKKYLGFDLSTYKEYIGAMILALPNPYLRMVKIIGVPKEASIIASFYERIGKSIIGGEIEISDIRISGQGFQIKRKILKNKMLIKLPYIVKGVNVKLFDTYKHLIYEDKIKLF